MGLTFKHNQNSDGKKIYNFATRKMNIQLRMALLCALVACVAANMAIEDSANQMQKREDAYEENSMPMERRIRKRCMTCTLALELALPMIDKLTDDKLFPMLQEKCEKVSNEAEKQLCLSFAGDNGKAIVDVILSIFEADMFCKLVKLCK